MFLIVFFDSYFFGFTAGIAAYCSHLLYFSLSFLLKSRIKHSPSGSPVYHLLIPKLLYKSLCGDIHLCHAILLLKIHEPYPTIFTWTISRSAVAAGSASLSLCVQSFHTDQEACHTYFKKSTGMLYFAFSPCYAFVRAILLHDCHLHTLWVSGISRTRLYV